MEKPRIEGKYYSPLAPYIVITGLSGLKGTNIVGCTGRP